MTPTLDADLLRGWAQAALRQLEQHCAEINRINVFPVPDRDTGTNLVLTMRAAVDAMRRAMLEQESGDDGRAGPVAAALARGALVGARGNSGVILSQLLRGLADALADPDGAAPQDAGRTLARALARAEQLTYAAIDRPREGTVLTVLRAAAHAAHSDGSGELPTVAVAAADAAVAALRATTGQLPELARAGVVDAGGLGLCLVLEALAELVAGRAPTVTAERSQAGGAGVPLVARGREVLVAERERGSTQFDYEVMYLLDTTDEERVARLRSALAAIGDSVAVVGDGTGLWNVHVHCTDIGAAIEAGIAAGRPHRITVVRFADEGVEQVAEDSRFSRDRAVLMVVTGAEAAELARSEGADVLERPDGRVVDEAELGAALAGTRSRHVVVLPCDPALTEVAERAAAAARRDGQEVVVVPTASVVQGLAALAVHDPGRRAGDDVVAMAEAAAATRTGALQIAETEALTWVGRCQPGEVLGIVDDDVVLIAPDLAVGALWLAHRMLAVGGELVTVLLGADVEDSLGEGLVEDLRRTHPEVDVVVYRGGQPNYPLILGVE